MSVRAPVTSGSIYRSPGRRRAVHDWCRGAWDTWPELRVQPVRRTGLGATATCSAPGGPGTPVVLLPGTNFNAATALPLARELAADRTVHLVDLPGQPGLSAGRRPTGDRTAAYGAWLDELLPQLTDRPVLVLGHSLGAAIALAATPGPLVAGMLLVNPAGLARARISAALLAVTAPWLLAPGERTAARLLGFMSGPGHHPGPTDSRARWLALVGAACRTALAPGPLPTDALRRWAGTPVGVVTGTHDRFFPPERLARGAAALGTEVTALDGAGHLAPDERPEEVRALLTALAARAAP
ncbi:alpha/beta hydrolase [Saccharopolyspora cebuensis]|uniref:Alpha/beta fold hydrolase n=1 Tax=Saccharopolyspora cebuensis TaxID=418759 RepID=A0ABV4CL63_9PSEU